ncbi:MAG: insulinase family protein [Clostridia bacterium]|nr:insulinase family protein [Clostridia bacterium]
MAEIITLENGLRIVLENNKNAKTCSVVIWVASGSSYETPETAGTSHFIEHMIFKGSEKRSALDIAVEMDEIGGYLNAYTARESTCFYARTLSEHMPKALDIVCDMVRNPRLDAGDIELEKGIIKEEIAMYEDDPEDICTDTFYEKVWEDSMLGSNILGTVKTVEATTKESLTAHMNKFYVPERTVISISGNFDKDIAAEIIRNYFSDAKNTGFYLNPTSAEFSSKIVPIKKDFMQNQLVLGFEGVPSGTKERERALLISSILGGTPSSRLFQHIRENLGLVYSIDTSCVSYLKSGIFTVCMGLSEKSEEKAITETVKIISEFSRTVTEKELARAKEQAVTGFVMDLENPASHASRNGRNMLLYNKEITEDEVIRNIRAVTLEDIRKTASELFDMSKISLCVAGKVKSQKAYKEIINSAIERSMQK